MNKIHRDGVDIGVAFSSAAKRLFYKESSPNGGESKPPQIGAHPILGNANTSEQRPICLRGRIKAALRTIAKFAYSLMRPFLRRIGFRLRRYFTEGLRQEILQEFQRVSVGTLQEVQTSVESLRQAVLTTHALSLQEFHRVSAGTLQSVQTAVESLRQDVLTTHALSLQEFQRVSAGTLQKVQASVESLRQDVLNTHALSLQEFQRVSAGTLQEVKESIPASIDAGIEDRFLKESAISRHQDAIYISNGLIDVDSYLHLSMQNEVGGWSEFKTKYGDDGWYFLYEKIFRGSEAEITKRQNKYIVYLQNCYSKLKNRNEQGYFLDFGSGRGEFLSLLTKENIPARGVDSNHLHIEHAAKKGVDAICIDGISYLKKVKNNALYGITMFQVAEHLEFQMLKNFVNLSFRKIMPGGIILIETVNPRCVRAMQNFYLDPSHVRPYPPELLKFQLEWEGFTEVKVIFYMPVFEIKPEEDYTNYVGYALVGYKPIDEESK